MSIEFFSTTNPEIPQEEFSVYAEALVSHLDLDLVRNSENEFGFRFCDPDHTEVESITLSFSPSGIYVGFHSATGLQRESFLDFLSGQFDAAGYSFDFEEE